MPEAERGAGRRLPLIVACALFMENLDSSILATALPAVASSLNANPLHLGMALSAYLLGLAVFIPASGWIADRYGARRVFCWAIAVFTLASLLCGLAPDAPSLVAARVLQGVGGALMVPVGRLIVLRRVPKHDLVNALAWITVPALVAPMIAPPLGGLLATYVSWRWIFWINLPIGVVGLWLAARFVPDDGQPAPARLDLAGWGLLALSLPALLFGLETLVHRLIPPLLTAALLLVGTLGLVAFVRRSRKRPAPLLPLELLRQPTFRIALVGGNAFRCAVGASSLLLPLMLQDAFGLTAAQSGALTFAGAVGALTMRTRAAAIVRRFGFRRVLMVDAVASALLLGCGALLEADTPRTVLLLLFGAIGLSRSILFTSVNTMGYADVGERDMSGAASLTATAQQLSTMLGVTLASVLLQLLSMASSAGPGLVTRDFQWAWCVVALLSLSSWWWFRQLPADAGSSVSGHRQLRTP